VEKFVAMCGWTQLLLLPSVQWMVARRHRHFADARGKKGGPGVGSLAGETGRQHAPHRLLCGLGGVKVMRAGFVSHSWTWACKGGRHLVSG